MIKGKYNEPTTDRTGEGREVDNCIEECKFRLLYEN